MSADPPLTKWSRPGRILRVLGWTGLLVLFLSFPYGPLFPWSPVHPGYEKIAYSRADVYYPAGTGVPDALRGIDDLISEAERFHGFKMRSRVTVVLCDWDSFARFVPHRGGWRPGAVALLTGTVVYVTPRIAERGYDIGEFVRHELSHAVLHQNQSFLDALAISRQEWLCEGLAVSFGAQKAFLTYEDFLARARKEDLGPVVDPEQRDGRPLDYRYGYQAWRYFLEHLIQTRGRAAFQQFLAAYISDPERYRHLFAESYGITLRDAIRRFQEEVREGGWKPDPAFAAALGAGAAREAMD